MLKYRALSPTPGISASAALGRSLRNGSSNQFSKGAGAVDQGAHLEKPLLWNESPVQTRRRNTGTHQVQELFAAARDPPPSRSAVRKSAGTARGGRTTAQKSRPKEVRLGLTRVDRVGGREEGQFGTPAVSQPSCSEKTVATSHGTPGPGVRGARNADRAIHGLSNQWESGDVSDGFLRIWAPEETRQREAPAGRPELWPRPGCESLKGGRRWKSDGQTRKR